MTKLWYCTNGTVWCGVGDSIAQESQPSN
jgi:hypothetical protein